MAVDTDNEKLALMSFMQPWMLPLPWDTDGIGADDQQHMIWGYPDPEWATVAAAAYTFKGIGIIKGDIIILDGKLFAA